MRKSRAKAQLSLIDAVRFALQEYDPAVVEDPAVARAAVALILKPGERGLEALFIERARRRGDPWSGQMALPGGRAGPTDMTLLDTAMRETREEVALDLARAQRLGQLDDLAPHTPTLPPIAVRPFVFFIEAVPALQPNEEVAAALWIPLSVLAQPRGRRDTAIKVRGRTYTLPAYVVGSRIIWGMTERILTPFLQRIGLRPLAGNGRDHHSLGSA